MAIFPSPLGIEDTLGVVDDWLHHAHARVLNPTDRHAALLARLLIGAGQGGNLSTDAHLTAIAIEHGVVLGSFDRDFECFPGLRRNTCQRKRCMSVERPPLCAVGTTTAPRR